MLALLPLIGLLLLWGLVTARRAPLGLGGLSKRGTLVAAFVALQAILVALTETLSIGHNLTSSTLTLAWVAVDLVLGGVLLAVVDRTALRVPTAGTAITSVAR